MILIIMMMADWWRTRGPCFHLRLCHTFTPSQTLHILNSNYNGIYVKDMYNDDPLKLKPENFLYHENYQKFTNFPSSKTSQS